MKRILPVTTLIVCGFTSLNLMADEARKPYVIQRGEEVLVVTDMPKFTTSDPITNSFIYMNGEYIPSPYIVSVSNLMICINGIIINNYELGVHKREYYTGRIGPTPETVGRTVDRIAESYMRSLQSGTVSFYAHGGKQRSYASYDGDGGALAFVEKARKAKQGDENARQELIAEMGLEDSLSKLRPDWVERLANNTNLETRATKILEAKRERERKEREKREQQNR